MTSIASRTHTFLQFGRYHENMIEYFDIGNHLELAARILARPQFDTRTRLLTFNVETNKATYCAANGGAKPAAAGIFGHARTAVPAVAGAARAPR